MLGHEKSIEKQIRKEKHQEQTLRQHLTSLQTWELKEGENLEAKRSAHAERMIRSYHEKNQILQEKMQEQLPLQEKAVKKAKGKAKTKQKPAKETFKEKIERKQKDKRAKEAHPEADAISYDMVRELKENAAAKMNAVGLLTESEEAYRRENKVDRRVLNTFVHGFKVDKKGNAASKQDEEYRAQDRAFLEDYLSQDVEKRRPHLERMVNDLLTVRLSEEMTNPAYIMKNMAKAKEIGDRFTYFQNVWDDPINKPYFDSLSPLKKALIKSQILDTYAVFSVYVTTVASAKGVEINSANYLDPFFKLDQFKGDLANMEEVWKASREARLKEKMNTVREEVERRAAKEREEQLSAAEAMKQQAETMEGDIGGLNLTSFVTGYSFETVAKYRQMIEKNTANYQKNPQLIDRLYQAIYKGIDALGDVTLVVKTYQGVIDSVPWPADAEGNLLRNEASRLMEEEEPKADYLRSEINSIMDAMEHLLRNKPMSEPAKVVLKRMGYPL